MSHNTIEFKLTKDDIVYIWGVTEKRLKENKENKTCAAFIDYKQGFANHFIGCASEYFIAKYLNIKWTGEFNTKEERSKQHIKDVGLFEVKTTQYNNSQNGYIIINSWDEDESAYILIYTGLAFNINKKFDIRCVKNPKLIGLGWAYGWEIKKSGIFKISNNKPSYWLHHLSSNIKKFDDEEFNRLVIESRNKYGNFVIDQK